MNPVIIVGGGLAGLAAAKELEQAGVDYRLLEATGRFGGKVATDAIDGFRLDRGFQVYFSAYPHAARMLDHSALRLKKFPAGARVFWGGKWHQIDRAHPLETLRSPLFGIGDKLRTLLWQAWAKRQSVDDIRRGPDQTGEDFLRQRKFSSAYIDRFARPFYGGITLDRDLHISSRQLNFIFKMLSQGGASVPEAGMGAISNQLEKSLTGYRLRTFAPVVHAATDHVTLQSGESLAAAGVILAIPSSALSKLFPAVRPRTMLASTCYWFAAPVAPFAGGHLALDGDGTGPVNHLAVMTNVAASYGSTPLIAATVLGSHHDEASVKTQMESWFPEARVSEWTLLRRDEIWDAQPEQLPGQGYQVPALPAGIFVAGEESANASIDGAIQSGVRAATAVRRYLQERI
jgi:hypothetical protein